MTSRREVEEVMQKFLPMLLSTLDGYKQLQADVMKLVEDAERQGMLIAADIVEDSNKNIADPFKLLKRAAKQIREEAEQ